MDQVGEVVVPSGGLYKHDAQASGQARNMSGLVCIGANHALMVADEGIGLHRLRIKRTPSGPVVSHDACLRLELPVGVDEDSVELDFEAVLRHEGHVLLVGSHANGRNGGKINPGSHHIALIDVKRALLDKPLPATWASLDPLFRLWQNLGTALNVQLQCCGINIEGATVWKDRLLIGLRSPVRQGPGIKPAAFVISTPFSGVMKGDFSGAMLHRLPTDMPFIGIRDMETVGASVLLVTGDSGVNDLEDKAIPQCGANINEANGDRPFQLRIWKPSRGDRLEPKPLREFKRVVTALPDGSHTAKVEGIAGDPAKHHAYFVVYDGSPAVFYLVDKALP